MGIELRRALDIVLRTSPYVIYRAFMYGAMCLCVIAYLAMLFAIGLVFGAGAFWVLFVISAGLAAMLGIGGFINEYVFHQLRAGHIAVITEIVTQGKFPPGISQTKWARGRVTHYFKGAGTLAHVRRLTRDVIRAVNRVNDLASIMPLPGIETGMLLGRRIIDLSQAYIEEGVFAYTYRAKNENVYESAKSATLTYSQCWRAVLGNAVTLTLISYGFALVCTVVFLIPLGTVALLWFNAGITNEATLFSDTIARFVLFAIGIFLGFAAKWAIFDPIASASIIITFLEEADITEVTPELEEQLDKQLHQFHVLREKASEYSAIPGFQPSFIEKQA